MAIEVKPVAAGEKGLARDLATLVACLTDADYDACSFSLGMLPRTGAPGCAPWFTRTKGFVALSTESDAHRRGGGDVLSGN